MRGITIHKGIYYIFQKKKKLLIIFYFLSIFLKKKKKKAKSPIYSGWPTTLATYGAGGGRSTPEAFGGGTGHPLVFNFFFLKNNVGFLFFIFIVILIRFQLKYMSCYQTKE